MVSSMLNRMLEGKQSIAIGGHIRPDGDCVGSCMGLYHYLKEQNPEFSVDVYLEEVPEKFHFIDGIDVIRHEIPEQKSYDLFICLDCGDRNRLGFSAPLFDQARTTFCIDHHVSNDAFATENYVFPDASSASELVYQLLDYDKISLKVAEILYMGIVHDTGVFQYSCAGPETFRTAAKLLEKGVNAPKLIDSTFYEKTYAQNRILGFVLLQSSLELDGKCTASFVSREDMKQYGVKPKDLDGAVAQLRVTEGTEVAILGYELENGSYKISLRAKEYVDVNKVANAFGGGGHVKAAGCTVTGSAQEILAKLLSQIQTQL